MKKLSKIKPYGVTALLTLISIVLMTLALKIYPFGDKAFLWTDGDQYFSFAHYFGSIGGKDDIFYSWSNALGGNAFIQLAYYSFSPFNLIFLILKDHMMLAAHIVAYIKIITASLAFFYCLDYLHRDHSYLMKAALSMCYSFMGYMIFYGWNTSWMDGVILLPVIYIGIIRIIENKSPLQYTAALCMAIISNFYIGFMLCICSFILYIAGLLLQKKNFREGLKSSFIRYALFSLSAVGMGMFVLLPTYLGLPKSRVMSLRELIKEMSFIIKPAEIISGLFTGQLNSLNGNAPLIYVGIFPLVLAVLFFVCRKASARKKMVYAALIVTLFLSFENSFLNVIWHGLSSNAWFNYRYSFFMSFVLLLIAYDSYSLIMAGSVSKSEYMKAGAVLLTIAAFVINDAGNKLRPIAVTADIIFICIIIGSFCLEYRNKQAFMAFAVLLMIFFSVANSYCYLIDTPVKDTQLSVNRYDAKNSILREARNSMADDSFYRMESSFRFGRCDGTLYNYYGVSHFSSAVSLAHLAFIQKLGVKKNAGWWTGYTADMPEASESLLGIKYLLTDTLNSKDYKNIGTYDEIQLYMNPNALPILFPSEVLATDIEGINNFEMQNQLWRSINGIEKDVFEKNTVENVSKDDDLTLEITVNKSGSVYIFVPDSSYSGFKAEGASIDKEFTYDHKSEIYYIGELSEGDKFRLIATAEGDNYDLDDIVCYTENKSVIKENAAVINDTDITIDKVSSSHIEMTYKGNRKNIATTIPYDEGWTIYDNGNKAVIQKNWGCLISFELDNTDDHQIRLIYRPKGLKAGSAISLATLLLIALYEIRKRHHH